MYARKSMLLMRHTRNDILKMVLYSVLYCIYLGVNGIKHELTGKHTERSQLDCTDIIKYKSRNA